MEYDYDLTPVPYTEYDEVLTNLEDEIYAYSYNSITDEDIVMYMKDFSYDIIREAVINQFEHNDDVEALEEEVDSVYENDHFEVTKIISKDFIEDLNSRLKSTMEMLDEITDNLDDISSEI